MKEGQVYLGKYNIIQVLKETEDVCVLLAEHIQLNSYWIIKKLKKSQTQSRREIHVLKGVKHPGIPLIIDVIEDGDYLVIIREYVDGKTLNEIVYEKGVLAQEEVVDIGIKLCAILTFLHEELDNPLIFRDVKPDNIIITKDNIVQLIDFGIARFHKEEKLHDTMYLGTKGFASPEQYGFSQTDVRTDVFGIGATLYFLLTKNDLGKPPYTLKPLNVFRKDINNFMNDIVQKACEINKNLRYQSVEALSLDLEKLVTKHNEATIEDELLRTSSELIIVNGIRKGIGATYFTIRLAYMLSLINKKVLVIDGSQSHQLMSLEYQEESFVERGLLNYKGIGIYSMESFSNEENHDSTDFFDSFDYILVDNDSIGCEAIDLVKLKSLKESEIIKSENHSFGHNKVDESKQYKGRVKSFLIATIAQWDVECIEEFILNPNTFEFDTIVVNLSSSKRFTGLIESMKELDMLKMPFKPFDELQKAESFDNEVLEKIGVTKQCLNKPSFFSPKNYKAKLATLIKSLP